MKKVTFWMSYTAHSEAEAEVPDNWEFSGRLEDIPSDVLSVLDAGALELSPDDWGVKG